MNGDQKVPKYLFSEIFYFISVGGLKKNQNAPRPSELLPVRGKKCQIVYQDRRDHRFQIQNLFMAFKRVPLCGSNIGSTV